MSSDGQPIRLLTSRNHAYWSARVFGTLASAGRGEPAARAALAWIEGGGDPDGRLAELTIAPAPTGG